MNTTARELPDVRGVGVPSRTRLLVLFSDEQHAERGRIALHDLQRPGELAVRADAVVAKDARGRVSVRRCASPGLESTVMGSLLGALVGAPSGPFALLALASLGGLLGAAVDLSWVGIAEDVIAETRERLAPGEAALIAQVTTRDETQVESTMRMHRGRIVRDERVAAVGSRTLARAAECEGKLTQAE